MTIMSNVHVAARHILNSAIASRSREGLTMPDVASTAFVVDDDVSVRESLELLIKSAGWQPKRSYRRRNFCRAPTRRFRVAWCST